MNRMKSAASCVRTILLSLMVGLTAAGSFGYSPEVGAKGKPKPPPEPEPTPTTICEGRIVTANVVAIDQAMMFNRIGAQNINYMVYALRRDVVNIDTNLPLTAGGAAIQGKVALRPDKRPRPLVLRVAAGDCLQVNLQNLLTEVANPFDIGDPRHAGGDAPILQINNQVAGRYVSFHPLGLQLVDSIANDGSFVGKNANSLLAAGASGTYKYYAEAEGAFMVYSRGQPFGGEASGGDVGVGLFAVVNVEPKAANFYRSQLNEEEMRMASTNKRKRTLTPDGQPIINYEASYPRKEPWISEGKAGLPILNILTDSNEIVHSDLNAIIAGPNPDGSFPESTYPQPNPSLPNRLEAFREYTVVFHDEQAVTQAYPLWYADPVLRHTLHGVRDSFMINYGSGGIGSEIISNRLGVGPMQDCLNCAYEEFFLTAYTVGDVGMLVDNPANGGLELCDPALNDCVSDGLVATEAFFPDDPSNVHHSYTGDFVKFRQLHAGPKEQHIFHLHNHQWLFNPNDDNSNYLDAQGIGPGSGYTLEINFGGSGNRNMSAGDAIFHCHFYPHFAQGMWEMWRIHDVTETGTVLAASGGSATKLGIHEERWALQSGRPASGARALPDGEIVAGTPIPAVVPLPGKAMAPMPGEVTVVGRDVNGDGIYNNSQALVVDRSKNPGFPFWIAGIEDTVGQRPTTPPLDMLTEAEAAGLKASGDPLWANMVPGLAGGTTGGLPRHTLEGYLAGGASANTQNRLDFTKVITAAKPVYFPETGTDLEKLVMAFNAQLEHPSYQLAMDGTASPANFLTNGNLPVPSAPYYEPCRDDEGDLFVEGVNGQFYGSNGLNFVGAPQFGALNPRVYKAANIQIDAVFNKAGYHFPQQRIITLWDDVLPTINKQRPPEPFVMRSNTFDCVKYLHTNLVPEVYELDDYQVRTPTDIIGQHIHLPKWDLVSNDGSGNGWNYEDGTLSPGAVRERIEAINHFNELNAADAVATLDGETHLEAQPHPYFAAAGMNDPDWVGARTTIQRWFTDPVVNNQNEDRGLGIIFTHDHYGPSTHQQVGLYATILAEPAKSIWKHNETGIQFATRHDGGPTSWQAQIIKEDGDAFREFYFEFSDFQHAYEKGVYVGANEFGKPLAPHQNVNLALVNGDLEDPNTGEPPVHGGVTQNTFRTSINPSFRQQANPDGPDIVRFPPVCPGGLPRPCAEAIAADDVGMLVTNYRNEPIGLRVYDPNKLGPDGKPGMQAGGLGGDLAFALDTRTDRAIPEFNTKLGDTPYLAGMTGGIKDGDPFTPMIRSYPTDTVKVKIQSGATEHEHNATIHGIKWLQGGSGNGAAPNSGWRNSQNDGISEQFTFTAPVIANLGNRGSSADYAYTIDASQDGWWSGTWGVMRTYENKQSDLAALPGNLSPRADKVNNKDDFDGVCPVDAPVRNYEVVAMSANQLLGNDIGATLVPGDSSAKMHVGAKVDSYGNPVPSNDPDGITAINPDGGTLVYNNRPTNIRTIDVALDDGTTLTLGGQSGPLHDPTALVYVLMDDLETIGNCAASTTLPDKAMMNCQVRLKADAPVEPVVLRANAGDCINVTLYNRLPLVAPDLGGFNTLLQMVNRDRNDPQGMTTFNNNLIRPSTHVGLHPQLVEYDVTRHDGTNVGRNPGLQTVSSNGFGGVNDYEDDDYDGILNVDDADRDGDGFDDPKIDGYQRKITYQWYAGDLAQQAAVGGTAAIDEVDLVATPVEFGGFNLQPTDKIKQGQKGLIGAAVIEPEGATWPTGIANLDRIMDHQVLGTGDTRATRTIATITNGTENFRDATVIFQKGINHRFGDGSGVPNIASEGEGIPEDSHDAGQMAINYGSEPMWFRFGMPADSPFEQVGLGGVQNSHEAFSNVCCNNGGTATTADTNIGDPVTPVFTAAPGQGLRMRLLEPTGVGRGTTFSLDGHAWQRDPYIAGDVASQTIGDNPIGMVLGHQESVTPAAHFDIVPLNGAGGKGAVPGDYLFSDEASFGRTSGLWGILRVQ